MTTEKTVKLPIPGKENILVTSALPYVNNVPHLGNIIGCVLSADVYARYCRQRNKNVVFVCGTDEYGTATETKALKEGLTPKQICDKYHAIHKDVYEWFDIQFDEFGRTSTSKQTEIAQDIFHRIDANECLVQHEMDQLFCPTCQRFLADRYVNGNCPSCNYEDARGDQCDRCGKLHNAIELINPKCSVCKSSPAIRKSSHLFLNLSDKFIHDKLVNWILKTQEDGKWTQNTKFETKSWIDGGLEPRCITRDLKWGTPVPKAGFENKVFYVWFDAPIGYISITSHYTADWAKWWKNEDGTDVKIYQFMGKDNIPFHTVLFPATLIAANDNYRLVHHVDTTEYLNYEEGKFSKSRNYGVFGDQCKETGIPPEIWRYYLLSNRPENSDTRFTWVDFSTRLKADLVDTLGNLINRSLSLMKSVDGTIHKLDNLEFVDQELINNISDLLANYNELMTDVKIRDSLRVIMQMASCGNAYMQKLAPWELKKNPETLPRFHTVLGLIARLVYLLAALSEPFMPSFTKTVLEQLNYFPKPIVQGAIKSFGPFTDIPDEFDLECPPSGHEIGTVKPIFTPIDKDTCQRFKDKYSPTEQSYIADIRVGKILTVEDHPQAEKLYVITADVGEAKPRTLCAGLKVHYKPNELIGKLAVIVCNLQTANLKGVDSQGMILVASRKGVIGRLTVDDDTPIGTPVLPTGYQNVNAKEIDIATFQTLQLKTNDNGEMIWNDVLMVSNGKTIKSDKNLSRAKVQ